MNLEHLTTDLPKTGKTSSGGSSPMISLPLTIGDKTIGNLKIRKPHGDKTSGSRGNISTHRGRFTPIGGSETDKTWNTYSGTFILIETDSITEDLGLTSTGQWTGFFRKDDGTFLPIGRWDSSDSFFHLGTLGTLYRRIQNELNPETSETSETPETPETSPKTPKTSPKTSGKTSGKTS